MVAKTVLVTGASRGLGFAIARYIVSSGNNVVMVARSKEPMENLKENYKNNVAYLVGDLRDLSIAQKAVQLAKNTFGRLDSVVINHGALLEMKRIQDTPLEEWRDAFDVNVFSAIAFAQSSIQELRDTKGSIVITSSGASKKSNVAWGVYGASKAVLDHFVGTLAAEERDITTLAIAPGTVDTEMQREIREKHHANFTDSDAKRFMDLHKDGKLLRPEVPGNLMARLALDPPKELSGEYFRWDVPELEAFRKEAD